VEPDYGANQRHDYVRPLRKTAAEENDRDPAAFRQNAEAERFPVYNLRASTACETTSSNNGGAGNQE
jgi:hypothetical protein